MRTFGTPPNPPIDNASPRKRRVIRRQRVVLACTGGLEADVR